MANSNAGELFTSSSIIVDHPAVAETQIRTYLQFFSARKLRYNYSNRVIAEINAEEALALNAEYQNFNKSFDEITSNINAALKSNEVRL